MNAFWTIVNSLTRTEMWVYGLVASAIITILGGWSLQRINHGLSIIRDRRKIFSSASQKLIEAFAPAIARLDAALLHSSTHDSPDVDGFLRDNFQVHDSAIEEFGRHIHSKRQLKKYQEAWKEYCCLLETSTEN